MPDFLRPRRPGQNLDSREVNQLVAHTEDITRRVYELEAAQPQAQTSGFDNTLLAQIVGYEDEDSGRRAFAWRWVHEGQTANETVSLTNRWAMAGDIESIPAYELSGNREVPVDGSAIVQLTPGDTGQAFYFSFPVTEMDAEVTGYSGGVYTLEQRFRDQSGTWSNGTLTVEAREANGRTDVANGTIVRASRGFCSGAPRVEIATIEDGDEEETYDTQSVGVHAAGGTYRLIFDETATGTNPQSTGPIAWDANATTVQAALNALPNCDSANVTSGNGTLTDRFTIEFQDSFANYLVMESDDTDLEGDQEWVFFAGVAGNGTVSSGNETALVRLISSLGNNTWRGHFVTHGSNGTDPMDIVNGGNVTVFTGAFNATLTSLGSGISNYRANQTLLCKVTPFVDGSNLSICLPQYVEPFANLTVPGAVSTDNQSFNGTKNFAIGTITIGIGPAGNVNTVGLGGGYGQIELRYKSSNATASGDGVLIVQNPTGFDNALVWAHQENSNTTNGNAGFAMTFNGTRYAGTGSPDTDAALFVPGFGPNGTMALNDIQLGGGLVVGIGGLGPVNFYTLSTDDIYVPSAGMNLTAYLATL